MRLIDIPKVLFWQFSKPPAIDLPPWNSHRGYRIGAPFKEATPWWLVYEDNRGVKSNPSGRNRLATIAQLIITQDEEIARDEEFRNLCSVNIKVSHTNHPDDYENRYLPNCRGFEYIDPRHPNMPHLLQLIYRFHELAAASEDFGPYRVLSEADAQLRVLKITSHS